ncbi:MAG: IS5/IS1182 family transposase, partial [Flavisolibacter sp.]|nr:IS5/IS1182 family transposase [Flavisolibacter sp.]
QDHQAWQHGRQLPSDKAIRQIRKIGRKQWKNKVGYHRRSIAESTIFRLKTVFGEKLSSRNMGYQEVEVIIKCYALNKMTTLGMPKTTKDKTAA